MHFLSETASFTGSNNSPGLYWRQTSTLAGDGAEMGELCPAVALLWLCCWGAWGLPGQLSLCQEPHTEHKAGCLFISPACVWVNDTVCVPETPIARHAASPQPLWGFGMLGEPSQPAEPSWRQQIRESSNLSRELSKLLRSYYEGALHRLFGGRNQDHVFLPQDNPRDTKLLCVSSQPSLLLSPYLSWLHASRHGWHTQSKKTTLSC